MYSGRKALVRLRQKPRVCWVYPLASWLKKLFTGAEDELSKGVVLCLLSVYIFVVRNNWFLEGVLLQFLMSGCYMSGATISDYFCEYVSIMWRERGVQFRSPSATTSRSSWRLCDVYLVLLFKMQMLRFDVASLLPMATVAKPRDGVLVLTAAVFKQRLKA